jgi:hypothetical protein
MMMINNINGYDNGYGYDNGNSYVADGSDDDDCCL